MPNIKELDVLTTPDEEGKKGKEKAGRKLATLVPAHRVIFFC